MPTQLSLPFNLPLTPSERADICRAHVHATTLSEAVDLIVGYAAVSKDPAYVVTTSAQHVVLLNRDHHFRKIHGRANLVVPDGFPMLLTSWLIGKRLEECVTGVDLMKQLCARAEKTGLRVFLLGGKPGSANLAAKNLKALCPNLHVCGTVCPPMGFRSDPAQFNSIAERITAAKPHLLFVGLSAPNLGSWILKLGVPISMGVGVTFKRLGSVPPRVPRWMHMFGLD